jgi:uncharacterized protein
MNKSYMEVTMRTKIFVPVVLLIAAAVISACSGAASAQTVETPQTPPRTINVTGNAQVMLTPNIAYVSIGVHSEAETAKAAVADNNSRTQAVIDAIKGQGVDAKDIQTTNFSVYQSQKYSPTGEDLGSYFMADNTVYVTMRDIDNIAGILDASIEAGANNIYGITFDVQDKSAVLASGRDQAVADARAQAEQLVAAIGGSLGDVLNISYNSNTPIPYYYDGRGMGGGAAMEAASVPISPGQLSMTVSVSITYELR